MTPDFTTLPEVTGQPDLRWVNGTLMDREQYQLEGWTVVKSFTDDNGQEVRYWACKPQGVREYGLLREKRRQERKTAWQNRQAADDEWSRHIEQQIERTP